MNKELPGRHSSVSNIQGAYFRRYCIGRAVEGTSLPGFPIIQSF
jgi:hypothetical protein